MAQPADASRPAAPHWSAPVAAAPFCDPMLHKETLVSESAVDHKRHQVPAGPDSVSRADACRRKIYYAVPGLRHAEGNPAEPCCLLVAGAHSNRRPGLLGEGVATPSDACTLGSTRRGLVLTRVVSDCPLGPRRAFGLRSFQKRTIFGGVAASAA